MVLGLATALGACSEGKQERVVSTWPTKGNPKEVRLELGEGLGVEVQQFHENGRIQIRGVLLNGARNGVWNTYRKDGLPWSQVTYKAGIKEGLFRTWHVGGTPHIEGQHKDGVPAGKWRFYSTEGDLVETEDFDAPK
jgi:antitoxin component YwqK of YwqJK toxin-antitoxin module